MYLQRKVSVGRFWAYPGIWVRRTWATTTVGIELTSGALDSSFLGHRWWPLSIYVTFCRGRLLPTVRVDRIGF